MSQLIFLKDKLISMYKNNFPKKTNIALFNLAFRGFFLCAAIFSIISISVWSIIYFSQIFPPIYLISSSQWHAHEMIYGYTMAVIAGFLLTAVKNWTGIQTIYSRPLMILLSLWVVPRLLFLFGTSYLAMAGFFDILFSLLLIISLAHPIIKAGQWKRQFFILSKIILIIICNISFYLGALDILDNGVTLGLYGGLYLVIALILTIGSRIVPFFIEKGADCQVNLFNSKWLNISSLLLFLCFFIFELFIENQVVSSYLALGLFLVNSAKLVNWYTVEIWKKSLLWSLYLSLCLICLGFLLFACISFGISKLLAIHTFAFAIGTITIGMMSRVALGHTGRNVGKPHKAISYALGIILIGAMVRVVIPLFNIFNYGTLIALSQILWIVSFLIFIVVYLPILVKPRVDGKFG